MLEIKFDDKKLRQVEKVLKDFPRALPKVMSRALNRTAKSARTQIARSVSQRLGGKGKINTIRKYIYLKTAGIYKWKASLEVSRFQEPLIRLKAKQTNKGVTYISAYAKGRTLLKHAFIATGAEKGTQVWLRSIHRIGYRKYIDWRGREMEAIYPMRERSLAVIVSQDRAILKKAESDSVTKLEKNINDQVNLILKKRLPA